MAFEKLRSVSVLGGRLFGAMLIVVAVGACSEADDARQAADTDAVSDEFDLRSVDWASASVDTSFCGGQEPVALEGGKGFVYTTEFAPLGIVDIQVSEPIVYGDLTGDERDEALVPLWCTNGGGMAAGQLAYGVEVFTPSDGGVEYLGTIEPDPPPSPQHTSYMDNSETRVENGTVVAKELFYGPKDGTCCPTGRRTSTWAVQDGVVAKVSSTVTAEPDGQSVRGLDSRMLENTVRSEAVET